MEDFASTYKVLDKQCRYYSRHLGHLKGLIDNDDWGRVVDGSISGRVLLLGNSEANNALVLFNTRMFDVGSDTITLRKLAAKLPNDREIAAHHAQRMSEIGIKYETERFFRARAEFVSANRNLKKSKIISKLQSLRKYTLAHNIEPEFEPDKATLNDLVELTEAVLGLVELAGYIIEGSRGKYLEFTEQAEKETRMLYKALPVLDMVERD